MLPEEFRMKYLGLNDTYVELLEECLTPAEVLEASTWFNQALITLNREYLEELIHMPEGGI